MPEMLLHNIKKDAKIAVIRFSSLGDIILAMPVLKILRHSVPEATIKIIVKEPYSELFTECSYIDGVIPLAPKNHEKHPIRNLIKKLQTEQFDLMLDWHGNLRSRLLSIVSIKTRVIRYRKGSIQRRLLVTLGRRWGRFPTTAEKYLKTIKNIKFREQLQGPELELSEQERQWAHHELSNRFPRSAGIVICMGPGARHATKRWPSDEYKKLAQLFLNSNTKIKGIVLLGDEGEYSMLEPISRHLEPAVINLAGSLSIRETASIIDQSHFMITNDTGLMHLATAVSTPVIAIFGPTSRELGFFPMGHQARVVETMLPCRPCSLHGSEACPLGTLECMTSISADRVYQEATKLLAPD
ncbi:glycosyltransferase family 9 protein [candidate division CSSED10-310 bacterium]|uniref:Glycosyltransferase family 9 protein n=1 Tax=candidate division CSSED10-310 bacterium TaxID=2855610 RepID=A0ABV6YZY3_UNCC1